MRNFGSISIKKKILIVSKECGIKAAQAGKHILCEKPIALSLKDADEMIKAAQKAGVKFMIAQVIRFWPEYVKLKTLFDSGELGKLISISCSRIQTMPQWVSDNWIADPNLSGGALLDLHIHNTDYLLYLLGKPESLFSKSSKNRLSIFTIFTFADQVVAFAEGNSEMPDNFPFTMSFQASFEKGAVMFNSCKEKTLAIYRQGKEVEYPSIEQEFESTVNLGGSITQVGPYFSEIQYFLNYAEHNRAPILANPQSARDSLEIVLSEMKSAETGRTIKF